VPPPAQPEAVEESVPEAVGEGVGRFVVDSHRSQGRVVTVCVDHPGGEVPPAVDVEGPGPSAAIRSRFIIPLAREPSGLSA